MLKKSKLILAAFIAVMMFIGFGAPAFAGILPTIDFEEDTVGFKPNGWQSADSDITFFTDTVGAELEVADFDIQSKGQALAVNNDGDHSALQMDFASLMTGISLDFGNDDPYYTNPGDEAILTLYHGDTQVGKVTVEMNRNDEMDQTITYLGEPFDKATFYYDATGFTSGLIEVVDNIVLTDLIDATVDLKPDTVNLKALSKLYSVTAYIALPTEFDVYDVDIETVELMINGVPIDALLEPVSILEGTLMVKFDKALVIAAIGGMTGELEVKISGQLLNGDSFVGYDTVLVIKPTKK